MGHTGTAERNVDLDDCLITAFNSARVASSRLLDAFAEQVRGRWDGPAPEADGFARSSEREIRKIIYEAFPEHPVYVGGGPAEGEDPELYWLATPLDGARSFRRGSPFFSVSLALMGRGAAGAPEPLLAGVQAPVLMEMYWAVQGEGSFQVRQVPGIGMCEGPVSVSDSGRAAEAAVLTGFIPDPPQAAESRAASRRMSESVMSLSAEESSSLGLAYVAAGRAEGFYLLHCDPWTLEAGALLVSEAGGKVTEPAGERRVPGGGGAILASNTILHWKLMEILAGD
jgi:myo-inositol-1(or 4)-monophosphatase